MRPNCLGTEYTLCTDGDARASESKPRIISVKEIMLENNLSHCSLSLKALISGHLLDPQVGKNTSPVESAENIHRHYG